MRLTQGTVSLQWTSIHISPEERLFHPEPGLRLDFKFDLDFGFPRVPRPSFELCLTFVQMPDSSWFQLGVRPKLTLVPKTRAGSLSCGVSGPRATGRRWPGMCFVRVYSGPGSAVPGVPTTWNHGGSQVARRRLGACSFSRETKARFSDRNPQNAARFSDRHPPAMGAGLSENVSRPMLAAPRTPALPHGVDTPFCGTVLIGRTVRSTRKPSWFESACGGGRDVLPVREVHGSVLRGPSNAPRTPADTPCV